MNDSCGKLERSGIVPLCVLLICVIAFVITNLALANSSNATESAGLSDGSTQVKELQDYRQWTKVNSTPQFMLGRIAAACGIRLASVGSRLIDIDGDTNPHRNKYFTVYVNEVGKKAMDPRSNQTFPIGSVIVKEKLPYRFGGQPELLTVMIKREKGFNKAMGDWEFMVTNGTGSEVRARGSLENCQACHLAKEKSDYVFRGYLLDGLETSRK